MKNNSVILNLVKEHFSLDERSIHIFEECLKEPFIDPVYQSLGLEDFRKKILIQKKMYEKFDRGWIIFKYIFNDFYENSKVTYDNFNSGFIDGVKLSNKIIEHYSSRMTHEYLMQTILQMNEKKLPKNKDLYLVLSLNFTDWFLCSTAEKWHSCLDLNSTYQSAFWAGLPGLITDKNRALVFLTDGEKKGYKGIITDRIISRTWVLLNEEDKLTYIKEYPFELLSDELISQTFGIETKKIDGDFISKYPLDFLYSKLGYSIFPYLDKSKLKTISGNHFIKGSLDSRGGLYGYQKDGTPYDGSPYNCEKGLNELIQEGKEIADYIGEQYSCEECGIGLTEDEVFYGADDTTYCETCFYEHHDYCSECGKIIYYEVKITYPADELQTCAECFPKKNQHKPIK